MNKFATVKVDHLFLSRYNFFFLSHKNTDSNTNTNTDTSVCVKAYMYLLKPTADTS